MVFPVSTAVIARSSEQIQAYKPQSLLPKTLFAHLEGSSHSWAQFCDSQGSQVSDNESVSIQPSADSCVLTQWWWGQVACLPTLFISGTPEWSEILCTFLRTLVLGKIFWCLAFHAYLHLCLSSILYFYNFLLDAVLCSCRLNMDLTVFHYIYLVTKKTEVSFFLP